MTMNTYSVAFATLGCRTNQYETDALAEKMKAAGFVLRDFSEKADVYVVNTCSVTAEADRKSRQFIRRAKTTNPDAVVIVMGCYSQLEPDRVSELGADYVCGNRNKMTAVEYALDALSGKENRRTRVLDLSNAVSREPEEIKKEAEIFAKNGYKEIVLTGTEIASYGKENRKYTLRDAISAVCSAEGIERVRIGSIEPSVLREDFIEYLASEEKFMPSFHLSLQSGSASVLARMKRKYNPEMVLKSVKKIRSLMPDAGFSADIIVGFPNETEEEFEETCRLVKEIGLYHAHIFPYSDFEEKKNGMWLGHAQNMFDVEYDSPEDLCGQTLILLAKEYRNGVVTATSLGEYESI